MCVHAPRGVKLTPGGGASNVLLSKANDDTSILSKSGTSNLCKITLEIFLRVEMAPKI